MQTDRNALLKSSTLEVWGGGGSQEERGHNYDNIQNQMLGQVHVAFQVPDCHLAWVHKKRFQSVNCFFARATVA